ncbi:MAG: hypothetical protein BWY72_01825 [Bacteroidetes bacterium ADurb.Bin416]|nr:MAG: hypothetical protein BWY72_01825 [Bacteroidetes bacterium ADurb.Bin416]
MTETLTNLFDDMKTPNGDKVTDITHSHLNSTPYITATDICTFRLYGPLCGLEPWGDLSFAVKKWVQCNIETSTL